MARVAPGGTPAPSTAASSGFVTTLEEHCSQKKAGATIFVIAVIVGVLAVVLLGVRLGGDTPRYTEAAEKLLAGRPLPRPSLPYSGYVAVVAVSKAAGLGVAGVVGVQVAVAAASAVALWALGNRMAGGVAGVVAALLFVFNPMLVRWHTYVLTDSLYISMVGIVCLSSVVAVDRKGVWYAPAAAACLFAAFLRPNGWLLIPVVGIYWLVRSGWPRAVQAGIAVAFLTVLVTFLVVTPFVSAASESVDASSALVDGMVIWGWRGTDIPMPPPPDSDPSLVGYILNEPAASTRLMLTRVLRELAYVRPYNSVPHNLVAVAYFLPVYATAVAGAILGRRRREVALLVALVLAQVGLIAATFADYDSRFVLYLLAPVVVLSGIGIYEAVRRRSGIEQNVQRVAS